MLKRFTSASATHGIAAVALAALTGASSASGQTGYTFNRVADTAQVAAVTQASCFAVNGQGTVLFTTADGRIWLSKGGVLSQVAGPGSGGQPLTASCAGLNDNDEIVYAVATPGYTALVKQSGGSSTELARSDVSPFLATTGNVTIHSLTNGGVTVAGAANGSLYLAPSGAPVFTLGPTDPALTSVQSGTMNQQSIVAFLASRLVQGVARTGVYRSSGTPLVEDGNAVVSAVLASRPVINENNVVAFLGQSADGTVHVFSTADGVAFTDHSGALINQSPAQFAINSAGTVVFVAPIAGGTGLFSGSNPTTDTIIVPGDALDGSTVISVRLGAGSLNDQGQVAFWAELADGRAGVYVAAPVQAPTATDGSLATTINSAAGGVLAGSDPQGLPLTFAIVSNGSRGTASITNAATGAYTYTPNANAIGTDTFTFRTSNPYVSSSVATVTVNIAPGAIPNRAPVAVGAGSVPATSVRFDSVADELYRTTSLPPITSFTMMGWFRWLVDDHTYSTFMRFGSNIDSRSYNIELCCGNGWDGIYLWTGTGGGLYQVLPKMTKGTWYHLAVTVEGSGAGQLKVYINGGAPKIYPGNPGNSAGRFSLGSTPHAEYLNGSGAAVKFYSAPLTQAEIVQEMNQFNPVRTTDLYAFYPLQSAETARFDYSGNDRNLTQTGTPLSDPVGPPLMAGMPVPVAEDSSLTGTLQASDPDGNPLRFFIETNPTKGTVVITNPDTGAYVYTPNPNATGSDTFTFKANDGLVDSNVATMALTITPVNDPPTASNGSLTVQSGAAGTGTLLATDIDSSALTYAIVANGSKGTAVVTNAATGAFTYTATPGAGGTDTFTFVASDGASSSNVATVMVTITPAPTAANGTLSAVEDVVATGTLVASDPNGLPLTYSIVTNGTRGTAAITNASTGAFQYTPLANANGTDSFTFRATNGTTVTNTATIAVTITPVNDAPVAANGTATVPAGSSVTGTLIATDIDNTTRTFAIVTNGTKGTVTITNAATGAYTYTANPNTSGTDSFTFRANDGNLNSNVATVTVSITASANRPPIAVPLGVSPATSIRFDSNTDELSRTTALPSITNFTLMGWFRVLGDDHTYSSFMRLGHATTSYGYNVELCCGNGWDDLYMWTGTGGGLYFIKKLTKGTWYHFAATVEGTGAGQVKVYLNGALAGSYAGNANVVAQKFWIGNNAGSQWLDGNAADVKVYDAVLTAPEIVQEMNQFTPVRTANLNSFYPLQDANTATLDASGNNMTLTPRGTLATDSSGPPLLVGTPIATPSDTPLSGTLQGSDPDGDPLTFSLGTAPTNGSVVVNPNGTFTYTPSAGFAGNDSFTFVVSDGQATSTASVRIKVGS